MSGSKLDGGFDKVTLKDAPIEKSWIVAGKPKARNAILSQTADRAATTILWECTEGQFNWHYDFDESIYFLEGQITIQRPGEAARSYGAGDWIQFSVGDKALWTVTERVRKVAYCSFPPPQPVALALRAYRGLRRRMAPARDAAPSLMGA